MNLDFSPEDTEFGAEVRDFLNDRLTDNLRMAGKQATSVFTEPRYSLEWQSVLHEKGWVAPAWPKAYGGTGWSEVQRYIFETECALAHAPSLAPMGINMVGPCIIGYGTEEQKAFFLPRILSGEDYWCQGYSEPGAGSDLASLKMQAVSDGDDYVLNGSKIWTTHAHHANRMFCLVRTDNQSKPQKGITFLLLEMDTPGIKVNPIHTIAGEHEVNQVFFDNVRIPKAGRIGAENDGWTVAKYLLEFERSGGSSAGLNVTLQRIRSILRRENLENTALAMRLSENEIRLQAITMTEQRVLSAFSNGENPGPAASMLKMQRTEIMQAIDELGIAIGGQYTGVSQIEAVDPQSTQQPVGPEDLLALMPRYLNNRAASIYGGSNEIQRNIIAKAVLKL
jgi:acyl-CoA dehydrogenase